MPSKAIDVAKRYYKNHDTTMGDRSVVELAQLLDGFAEERLNLVKQHLAAVLDWGNIVSPQERALARELMEILG